MTKQSAKGPTMGDIVDYQSGKFHNQLRNLTLRIVAVLILIALVPFLIAVALDRGSDHTVFFQSAALNLSTEIVGALVTFLLITLYWERRSSFLRETEKQLQQASEQVAEDMQKFTETLEGILASHGVEVADLKNPEVQDMPIKEVFKYLSDHKRNTSLESPKMPVSNPTDPAE